MHSEITSTKVKNKEANILKWADKLLTNSKNVKQSYKKKLNLDFDYIYGPIDIKKFEKFLKNISKNQKQVVYIGRDSYEKGIDILKKIEVKINAKVVYCTNLNWESAMQVLKSSDIVIVPSRIDNIPNVIKEAFVLKIPVVATDIKGISEIVTNGVNGILVPSEEPDKLANAVNQLLENKEKIKEITENGYDFVMKNLTWDILLPKYIEFYKKLIK